MKNRKRKQFHIHFFLILTSDLQLQVLNAVLDGVDPLVTGHP